MTDEEFYKAEAKAFIAEHPDYIATDKNRDRLFEALKEKELNLNRENLALVWAEIKKESIQ